ncbi:hypothetical protein [Acinetobacter sp. MD2]|uniref:hypothetical protein n=1 Tax=Acinetobacter sp. MD2 TaxID=2600066 RepID=UPI002D1E8D0D|nr:hypothetical protein [Acinetobacter sp. MD2]MEB3767643.1 hypothetical protein [Acinetobacter sp. MD2]
MDVIVRLKQRVKQSCHLLTTSEIHKVEHLQDNVQAVDLILSSETLQHLNDLFVPQAICGERYTEKDLAFLDN